jgi:hypothetical protein
MSCPGWRSGRVPGLSVEERDDAPRDEPSQVTRGELFDALYRARQGSELFFVLRTEAAVESSRVGEGSVMAFALASAEGGW